MSEALSADISIGTHEAFRNLAALLAVVDNAQKSLENMGQAIHHVDAITSEFALDLKEAEEQFKRTGSEADKIRMEELRRALSDASDKSIQLRREQNDLRVAIDTTNAAQGRASRDFVASARDMGTAGEKAGRDISDGQDKALKKLDDTKKSGKSLTDVIDNLSTSALSMVGSFLGLSAVLGILRSMEEATKAQVEAMDKLVAKKMTFDESIRNVVARLGFEAGAGGQERAGGLVTALQRAGGGVAPDVATAILTKAQATGFTPIGAKPELDTQTAGFAMSAMVAQFSQRQNLDAETAGKLFNLAQAAGVKSKSDMEKMLATVETSFREIAVSDPSEGYRVAIRSVVGRMEEDRTMGLQQAMAVVAAASTGASDARRITSNVEAFSRAAIGGTKGAGVLAEVAAQRGLITPGAVTLPAGKGSEDEIRRIGEESQRLQVQLDRSTREQADAYTDYQNQRAAQMAQLEAAQLRGKGTPVQREEAQRQKQAAIDKFDREMGERFVDADATRANMQTKIAENQHKIMALRDKDAKAMRELSLTEAYGSLTVSQREELLYSATEGMTDAQLSEFVSKFATGAERITLMRMLSPQARAVRSRVIAGRPDIAAFRRQAQRFAESNTVSLAAQEKAEADAQARAAAAEGGEFVAGIFGTEKEPGGAVATDIAALRASGRGGSGLFESVYQLGAMSPASAEGFAAEERTGLSEASLQAKRGIMIIYDRFARWIQGLDPRTRTFYDVELKQLWGELVKLYHVTITNDAPFMGEHNLADVKVFGAKLGEFMQRVNSRASRRGERVSSFRPTGLLLPSKYGDVTRNLTETPPESTGTPTGAAIGPPETQPTGAGETAPSGVGATPVSFNRGSTYNLNIGTVVSQGADALIDLPGRLDTPDLT